MNKPTLLALLLAAVPAVAAANSDRAGGEMNEVPSVDAPAETFDKWLGSGEDGRDLSELIKHLHGRIHGGRSALGLDQALGRADAAFTRQGGADPVQKALLYNGKEAREGLREAYDALKDYADKLGKAWRLKQAADGRLMAVLAKQADASGRVKTAAAEAKKVAAGIESAPPRSEGGDAAAGDLSGVEPQEREIADVKEMLDLAKEALAELDGRLKGLDAMKARVKRHAERAGMLDKGAGAALAASVTGKGSQAAAGSSKEIIADALATLEKAGGLGEKSRTLMAAVVERLSSGTEKAKDAETAILAAKGEAQEALDAALKSHSEVEGSVRPAWEAASDPAEKEAQEAKAAALKSAASGAAGKAASAARAAAAQAEGAKAACTTCNCAKKKATKAIGEPEKLEALKRLDELNLRTAVQDGEARVGAGERRVNTDRMRSLMRGAGFDGARVRK